MSWVGRGERGARRPSRQAAPPLQGWRPPGAAGLWGAFTLLGLCLVPRVGAEPTSIAFLHLLGEIEQADAQLDHYTATFLIQESVDGRLAPKQSIALKFKKPFKVYLRWIEGPHEGRQAIYPAGADGNELWVRVPLLVGSVTVTLDPESPRARQGARHAITDIGIGRLIEFLGANVRRGAIGCTSPLIQPRAITVKPPSSMGTVTTACRSWPRSTTGTTSSSSVMGSSTCV